MRKYRNVKCERDGYKFDSLRERAYYDELCLRKKAGDVKSFVIKPTFWVAIGKHSSGLFVVSVWQEKPSKKVIDAVMFRYTPDFLVDGELVDTKGKSTEAFRIKARTMAGLGMPIKIVK